MHLPDLRSFLFVAALLGSMAAASPGRGADGDMNAQIQSYAGRLIELNRIPADQNPKLVSYSDIRERKIVDNTGRVMGEVTDVYIAGVTGATLSIAARLQGAGATQQEIYLADGALKISPRSGSYELPYHRDELKEELPGLIASVEPAAGEGSDVHSVGKLIGESVYTSAGRRIGRIGTVYFNESASQAIALGVEGIPGISRKVAAVPFEGLSAINNGGLTKLTLAAGYEAALLDRTNY